MSSLAGLLLLEHSARMYDAVREKVEARDITKEVHALHKVIKEEGLNKEILERQYTLLKEKLHQVEELEESLVAKKKRESVRVAALKKEVEHLRERLAAANDKHLEKKVAKLSHLLSECMTRQQVQHAVAVEQKKRPKIIPPPQKHRKGEIPHRRPTMQLPHEQVAFKQGDGFMPLPSMPADNGYMELPTAPVNDKKQPSFASIPKENDNRKELLRHRLLMMRHELEIVKHKGDVDPKKLAMVEEQLKMLESKLSPSISSPVKHKMTFQAQVIAPPPMKEKK